MNNFEHLKVRTIINEYYTGESGVEEVNKKLIEAGYSVRLAEGAKEISDREKAETIVDPEKGICTGWALVNIGVGCLEKMQVFNGKLVYPLGDHDNSFPYEAYMGGYKFKIEHGETLVIVE